MADTDTFETRYKDYQKKLRLTNEENKRVLFDALEKAGIVLVTVTFDGEGDSGQIENIDFEPAIVLDNSTIDISEFSFGSELSTKMTQSVSEAVETVCYGLLSQDNGGWENNDGAYGQFTFNVAERTIDLDFNARFTSSECYSY